MTPPEPGRDVLCLAGGTGLAPLKAIVEHVITSGSAPPRVRLLYGARTSRELYDLPDLMRMRSRVPRFEVVPVVSDEPRYGGERGRLAEALAMETRPLLQGARLTAWELDRMGAPYRLIADSAGPFLLARGYADVVLIGADRIAADGDTANKIGSYALALGARRAGVPFVVVAPESTVDR
ncbi:hypothetical protein ACFQ08_45005, partial [Streptosporangium algeriense]